MILVDVNLLVYAHMSSASEHPAAKAWLDGQLNGATRVGLPWASLLGFLRVATNSKAFVRPQTLAGAWEQVKDWLDSPVAWIPEAGVGHRDLVDGMMVQVSSPRLITDVHLAALAMEHGLTLCSTDGDFARFRGLKWQNPLRV